MYSHNISGRKDKIINLNYKHTNTPYDFNLSQEPWYNSSFSINEIIHMTDYTAYGRDRSETTYPRSIGGGKNKFHTETIQIETNTLAEIIGTKTNIHANKELIIINIYKPTYHTNKSIKELTKIVYKIQDKYKTNQILIIGDLNQFKTKWKADKKPNN